MKGYGFSLLEMLLVISLVTLLAGVAIPFSLRMMTKVDLDAASSAVFSAASIAQTHAQASINDSAWGVLAQSGSVILFQGSSFSGRNQSKDETRAINPSIAPSGLTEIVFQKVTGEPNIAGTLTLNGLNNDAHSITISAKGTISY